MNSLMITQVTHAKSNDKMNSFCGTRRGLFWLMCVFAGGLEKGPQDIERG